MTLGTPAGAEERGFAVVLGMVERRLNDAAALTIAVTTVLVVVDVGLAVLRRPTYVSMEISPFLMALIAFLSAPYVTATAKHIRADFLEASLSPKSRALIQLFLTNILFVLYAAVLLGIAVHLTANAFASGERTQGILRTPIWIPQLAMVLGLLVLFLRTIVTLCRGAVCCGGRKAGPTAGLRP